MIDEKIFEILRKQEEELLKEKPFYIHYNPSDGVIQGFRNYLDDTDSLPFLEFYKDELPVSLEEFKITDYKVIEKNKKLVLEKIEQIEDLPHIDNVIHQVKKMESVKGVDLNYLPFDLLIEQNNIDKKFYIRLSKELREKYKNLKVNEKAMSAYVTAENDPNILYKTLRFTLSDLVKYNYYTLTFDDFTGNKSNIFLVKYFQNYLHVDTR